MSCDITLTLAGILFRYFDLCYTFHTQLKHWKVTQSQMTFMQEVTIYYSITQHCEYLGLITHPHKLDGVRICHIIRCSKSDLNMVQPSSINLLTWRKTCLTFLTLKGEYPKITQHHGCWFSCSLHHKNLCNDGIGCARYTDTYLSPDGIWTNCAIPMLRNCIEYKHFHLFHEINSEW